MIKVKAVILLAVVCFLMLATGCGKDDDNPAGPQYDVPQELVGGWIYDSATLNGVPFNLGLILGWEPGTEAARFYVGADESFVYEELDADSAVVWTESGTFSVNGTIVTITVTENDDGPVDPPEIFSGNWAVDGTVLTLTTIYQGATVVITANKYDFIPER